MTWKDKPTYAQIETMHRLIEWQMTSAEAVDAVRWVRDHATRKEVCDEIGRLLTLRKAHKLDKAECFNSVIWDGYDGRII